MRTPPALVLSGPPGVGKTTVGWRVFDRCIDLELAPAFADLDLLGAAWPPPADDPHQSRLKATNLAVIWSNYRGAGHRCLVVAGVVENPTERRLLEEATGGPVVLCRLDASDKDLAQRIRHRGRETGDGVDHLVRRAAELSAQLAADDISDHVVSTADRTSDAVADEVVQLWMAKVAGHEDRA
ncbi:AAA family ATPase [Kribbella sp. WER1]